jgi:hypothetical protein
MRIIRIMAIFLDSITVVPVESVGCTDPDITLVVANDPRTYFLCSKPFEMLEMINGEELFLSKKGRTEAEGQMERNDPYPLQREVV